MTATEFTEIGEFLYGPNWKGAMGRQFDLNEKNVRRFATGERKIPEGLANEIERYAEAEGY